MTHGTAQLGRDLSFEPNSGSKIQIIDVGVPHARAMRELFAMLPPGSHMDSSVCVNLFDLNLLDEIDMHRALGGGA